jgi:hypothetical protein
MIEIFVGALVVLVAVASGRRWMQSRRSGGSAGIAIEDATSYRDNRYASRRGNDGEYGSGQF